MFFKQGIMIRPPEGEAINSYSFSKESCDVLADNELTFSSVHVGGAGLGPFWHGDSRDKHTDAARPGGGAVPLLAPPGKPGHGSGAAPQGGSAVGGQTNRFAAGLAGKKGGGPQHLAGRGITFFIWSPGPIGSPARTASSFTTPRPWSAPWGPRKAGTPWWARPWR